MTAAALIKLVLTASLFLTVVGVGLQARWGDARYLLRHPTLFARSFAAMNIVMPLAALIIAYALSIYPAVKLALVALMLSPLPPFLPPRALRLGGSAAYMVSLFTITSLLSIILIPLTVAAISATLGPDVRVPASTVMRVVGIGMLVPIAIGLGIRRVAPMVADRLGTPLEKVANIVLVVAVLPILVQSWPAMRSLIGNGTVIVIVALSVIGVIIGHVLGGPERDNRTVLALATASRHPAMAIAIADSMRPRQPFAAAAVLLAVIVGVLASIPYASLRGRRKPTTTTVASPMRRADDRRRQTPAA